MRGHFLPGIVRRAIFPWPGPWRARPRDLTAMLKLLAGHRRHRGARHRASSCRQRKQKTFKDFRVAVMLSDPVSEVDQPVQDLIAKLAQFLEQTSEEDLA